MSSEVYTKIKQPETLYLAFVSAMSERFGYYVIGFLLTLYVQHLYNFSDAKACAVFALFTALGYLVTTAGGYLADNFIGIKRCLGLGLLCEATGVFLLSIPTRNSFIFYIALGAVITGAGIFKTAPTNILGRSYELNDSRIDSGFSLYYMGLNIGSFVSSLVVGPVKDIYGWHMPFLLAGAGLLAGFIWFVFFKHYGDKFDSKPGTEHFSLFKWIMTFITILTVICICAYLISNILLANICFYTGTFLVICYFVYQIIISPEDEKVKIIVCLILIFMSIAFYVLYYQLFESIMLFISRNVDKHLYLFGFKIYIPAASFPGINCVSIIILSPILAYIYRVLQEKKKDLSITTKFPLGILIIGLCFFILVLSTYFASSTAQVNIYWLVVAIVISSAGELLTGALGVAMVTRIAPVRLYGIMMGAWFLLGAAMGANLSGKLAGIASIPVYLQNDLHASLHIYSSAFLKMGIMGIAMAIIGFLIGPALKKAANI